MQRRSVAPMKTAKIGYMILSGALCILGILLLAVPDFSAILFGEICGILLLLFGGVKLVGYFSRDLYRLAFQYDLISGILLLVMGSLLLVHPGSMMVVICISLGSFLLIDGLFKVQIALDAKKFGIEQWWLILMLAILTGVFGILLMFRPGEGSRLLICLLGISLLAEGILNFSTVITAVKIIKHQQPDIIEAGEYKEREV